MSETSERVTALWEAAHREWEEGRDFSPSAGDLLHIACDHLGRPHEWPDDLEEQLFQLLCEGTSLNVAADWLLERMPG